jgi:hypothetical protein
MSDNPRLNTGWPFDPTADYTATWERIERRAGHPISYKDRCSMHAEGVVFKGCTGRPPNRTQYVFLYWTQYLTWLGQKKKEKLLSA